MLSFIVISSLALVAQLHVGALAANQSADVQTLENKSAIKLISRALKGRPLHAGLDVTSLGKLGNVATSSVANPLRLLARDNIAPSVVTRARTLSRTVDANRQGHRYSRKQCSEMAGCHLNSQIGSCMPSRRAAVVRAFRIAAQATESGDSSVAPSGNTPDLPPDLVRFTRISNALQNFEFKSNFPFSRQQLTPQDSGSDGQFYLLPRFVQHADEVARQRLTRYYEAVLAGDVLDLMSSWTSHYPRDVKSKARRVLTLGMNIAELLANPSRTEWPIVQDLNERPELPFQDETFDHVTISLSVDYLTQPLAVFREIARILRPNGMASMAFTNRWFPSKVVPIWQKPFDDDMARDVWHAQIVAQYFYFVEDGVTAHAFDKDSIEVLDISEPGWSGITNPMIVVRARKKGGKDDAESKC